jgi:hypothetical protein
MPGCHDMKKGDIYVCGECGLELKVTRQCKDATKGADACGCGCEDDICCDLECCGKPLVKKG